ncbi:MAG: outer membrane protein transport protein [Candidatus Zixiibacteriota bacterium]|nr:MAG: outer membrane protein transport protein [candidate division Zixibacteria bacterium]
MSIVRHAATILVIIALFCPGIMAGGYENSGIGTQARGMGGAFRAVVDDWTAAYYNPAGYAFIYDNQLGANSAFLHLRNELIPSYRLDGIYETGVFNDQVNVNKHEIYSNPAGGFLVRLPIYGETVMGLSAFQPFDYNIAWKLYDLPLAYNDSLTLPEDQFVNNFDVVAFQLTLARELVEDKVSFGLGIQVLRADLIFNSVAFRDNPWEDDSPLNVRPFDLITEWNTNDGNGWGFGLKGGLLFNLNEKLNLGVTANLPFDITLSGSSRLEYYMPKITSLLVPGSESGEEILPGTTEYLFAAGGKIVDTADFECDLKLPFSVGAGLAYQVNDKLTVAFDAEYTFWSKYEGLDFVFTNHRGLTGAADTSDIAKEFFIAELPFGDTVLSHHAYPVEWQDAGKVMMGIRYKFNDRLTLLGGGAVDQSPAREATEITPQFVDTGTKYSINGGVLFHHGQWDFGLAGSYTDYPDQTVPDLVDSNEDGLFDSFAGVYSAATYETVLSFQYRF